SFQPGLARFESQRGNVALGVGSGTASFGAHSAQGRVVNAYDGRGADASAPVVTATSQTGNVLLYRGSARDNLQRMQQWPQSRGILFRAQTNAPIPVPRGAPQQVTEPSANQSPFYRAPVERTPDARTPPPERTQPPATRPPVERAAPAAVRHGGPHAPPRPPRL
ncbi:MAG: hypothetical protein ACLQPV_04405, partial [Vulcanimicrobiaceae bacterium]